MGYKEIFFPAEWQVQRAVQLTWPHEKSDWAYLLEQVDNCFVNIANAIATRQQLIIVCRNKEKVMPMISSSLLQNIQFFEVESNDTWARDHGGITVFEEGIPIIYDFCFNGWGMKFAANSDNLITRRLYEKGAFSGFNYLNMNFFILEGGSIESDGEGTILTTTQCLLSENRNGSLSVSEIEGCLLKFFGAKRVLWLKNGYLAGDDTDSHIDTLARFCNPSTIAYVKCDDSNDEHFLSLSAMEEELKNFRQLNGEPYKLVPLPMVTPVYDQDDGHRLPATYANFLIINSAVLVPIYNCPTDDQALRIFTLLFPDRDIVPVDCSVLIRQHGSLHCVTMQYPHWVQS
jgi:agmatine deiminase